MCLTPIINSTDHQAGVTRRWDRAPSGVPGRAERVGDMQGTDPRTQSPRFSKAGNSHTYGGGDSDPLGQFCANGSFLVGVLDAVISEIEDLVESNGAVVGVGIAAVTAVGGGGLLVLLAALFAVLVILRGLLELIGADDRLGELLETVKNALLDPDNPDPIGRAAGLFTWQLIAFYVFRSQQHERDYTALSYAVMDQHDYFNVSCEVNVDSVEVFFDASKDGLIAFVDSLLAYEVAQESQGRAFVGYASLRFTGPTRALLGEQRFTRTCAVEVACLRDVSGGQELIDYAVRMALKPQIGGILHWGQRNDATDADIQRLFGDRTSPTNGDLGAWRDVLATITDGGRLDGFSSEFTRRTGLEVQ